MELYRNAKLVTKLVSVHCFYENPEKTPFSGSSLILVFTASQAASHEFAIATEIKNYEKQNTRAPQGPQLTVRAHALEKITRRVKMAGNVLICW